MNRVSFVGLFVLVLCFQISKLESQPNYFDYHKQIQNAEEFIGNEEFSKALDNYEQAFNDFDYIFIKDYIIAAQIAILIDAEQKVSDYLEEAIIDGYPCHCVERNPIFKDFILSNSWQSIKAKEKEYSEAYNSRIRRDLLIEFSKRYKNEQDNKTFRFNEVSKATKYEKIELNNFRRIKSLMDSLVFPSERIIGLDRNNINQKEYGLSECNAGNSKVIVTLLHYNKSITEIGIHKYVKAIKLGYLHPGEFAAIYSYQKNNYTRLKKNTRVEKNELPNYQFNTRNGMSAKEIQQVQLDCEKFGIRTTETWQKLIDISKKYKFRINFDYK